MSKGIGKLFQVGIAKEATRGTAEAAATYWIPWSEMAIEERDEKVIDEQSRGVIEDSVGSDVVRKWAEGSFRAPLADKHFGLILLSALGTVATADNPDTDPSVKDHTFTVGQSAQHQSLTLFLDDPLAAQDYKHALGVLTSLEINYEQQKYIEYNAGYKAKRGATATLTPANTTENRFLPQHLTFKTAATKSGLDAAAAKSLKSLRLSIEKNIEDDYVLGSADPADFLNKLIAIEGEFEALWQNESDYKTDFITPNARALRLDLVNSGVTIGASANPQLRIDLAKCSFIELSRPLSLGDLVMQRIAFKAHYSISDTEMINAKLTNTVASY